MSDDQGAGAPSFGDLFDDPDAPPAPPKPPVAAPAAPRAAAPGSDAVTVLPPATAPESDLVTGHDLDHESDEASHMVAGFEHVEADGSVAPDPAAPEAEHESAQAAAMVAPFEAADAAPLDPEPAGRTPEAAAAAASVSVAASATPWDGTVDPAISSAPAGRVDTGRLYRSAGAEGPATLDAIPAIDPERIAAGAAATAGASAYASPSPTPAPERGVVGLTYSGVVVVVTAATVLVGFIDAVVRGEIGWLTGLALLVSSVYAAVFVRRADIWAAVVVPPLAFLAAALTAGQLTLGSAGTLLEREGFMLFKTLAVNAPWIVVTTATCLVIVLVRRRRSAV